MDLIQKYQFGFLFDKDFTDENIKTARLASFSASGYGNLPMWAHYSNNHQGFCVSYSTNFKDNPELSPQIFPVQYVEGRVDITQHLEGFLKHMDMKYDEAQKKVNKEIVLTDFTLVWIKIFMAFIKEKQWDYEKEFRILKPDNTPKPDKMEANPNAIYIGHKCKDEHKMKLINIAFQLNIPIYQMELNYSSQTYELIPKQIFI